MIDNTFLLSITNYQSPPHVKMENIHGSAASFGLPENGVDRPPHPGMADRAIWAFSSKRKCLSVHGDRT